MAKSTPQGTNVTIRLSPSHYRQVKAAAKADNRAMANYVRCAVLEALERDAEAV